jgi:signal transduction histidine kinase
MHELRKCHLLNSQRRCYSHVASGLGVSRGTEHARWLFDPEMCLRRSDALRRFESDLKQANCAVALRGEAILVGGWDPGCLDRAVENLLSNAIKFGAGKPIEITITGLPENRNRPAGGWS